MNVFWRYFPLAFVVMLSNGFTPQQGRTESPKVTCQIESYPSTKQKVPTTMIQNGTANLVPFIYWVEEVAGEKPLERCKEVSEIIQARYDDKTWSRSFLRKGKSSDNYPIICFVKEPKDKACDTERELIVKLKRGENAERVLDKMLALRYRTDLKLTGEFRFYYGETHREVYIHVKKFIEEVERSRTERQ
jgi:hypothetical protein